MTRFVAFAAAALGLVAARPGIAADVSGVWLTNTGDAQIRMARCAPNTPAMCGTIVWLERPHDANGLPLTDAKNPDPAKRSHPMIGTMVAVEFQPASDDPERLVGQFYNAEDGQTYNGSIVAHGADALDVTGCLLIFCQTQTWTRVPTPPPPQPHASKTK
jgi:uncharacterized protein (DUF2147 family)